MVFFLRLNYNLQKDTMKRTYFFL